MSFLGVLFLLKFRASSIGGGELLSFRKNTSAKDVQERFARKSGVVFALKHEPSSPDFVLIRLAEQFIVEITLQIYYLKSLNSEIGKIVKIEFLLEQEEFHILQKYEVHFL